MWATGLGREVGFAVSWVWVLFWNIPIALFPLLQTISNPRGVQEILKPHPLGLVAPGAAPAPYTAHPAQPSPAQPLSGKALSGEEFAVQLLQQDGRIVPLDS